MNLARAAVAVATKAAENAVPFSGPVVEGLLSDLLRIEDEQMAVLRSIEESVQQLRDGPWHAGRNRLEEAALPGLPPQTVESLLRRAADDFRDGAAQQPEGSFAQAFVFLDLTMTLAILGDATQSRYYAERAYLAARRAMWMATERYRRARRSDLDALRRQGRYFRDIEFAAAAFGDPVGSAQPKPPASEEVSWRHEALLDARYLAHKADLEVNLHSSLRLPEPWKEFWEQGESIVRTPAKPTLPSSGENLNRLMADTVRYGDGIWGE